MPVWIPAFVGMTDSQTPSLSFMRRQESIVKVPLDKELVLAGDAADAAIFAKDQHVSLEVGK